MKFALLTLSLTRAALAADPPAARAADVDKYNTLLAASMAELDKGTSADLDAVEADQEELLLIGIEACREFGGEDAEFQPMMEFIIESIPTMRAMTLDEIERQWHEGGALEEAGFYNSTVEHFGKVNSRMDMVLHPVTVMIALDAYRSAQNPMLLEHALDELEEVFEHLQHI